MWKDILEAVRKRNFVETLPRKARNGIVDGRENAITFRSETTNKDRRHLSRVALRICIATFSNTAVSISWKTFHANIGSGWERLSYR